MNRPAHILSLLFVSVAIMSIAAQDADSLLRRIRERPDDTVKVYDLSALYETYLYSDYQKAAAYNQQAYTLSGKLGFTRGTATALKHMGVLHQYEGKYDSARNFYALAGEKYSEIPDRKQHAAILANIASTYYDQGNYDLALSFVDSARQLLQQPEDNMILAFLNNTEGSIYLFRGYYLLASEFKTRALNYYTASGDRMRMADAESDMGLIFSNLGENQQALEAYETAAEIYKELNDQMFLGNVYINYANTLAETGNPDTAMVYLEKALALARQTNFLSTGAVAIESMGRLLHQKGRSMEGIRYLEKSLEEAISIEDTYQQASIFLNIAEVYIDLGQPSRAKIHLDQAKMIATKGAYTELLKNIHFQYYRMFELQGLPGKALREHIAYTALKDSLFNAQESRHLAEFEILYEMEKNRQQVSDQQASIVLLQKENKIRAQQATMLVVILGSVLLLATAFYIALRNRNKRIRTVNLAKIRVQQQELEFKNRELTSFALHLSQKNRLLDELKDDIEQLRKTPGSLPVFRSLKSKVHLNNQVDRDWYVFKKHFEEVHPDFFTSLQSSYPQLSGNDMRLIALLKLNLSSKEIASILNITPESVKKSRYRLRKKLHLEEESNINSAINTLIN